MRDLSSLRATPARTPPPDGLDAVLGEARRRLRKRVAGSSAVVAVAALIAASLPSSLQSNGMRLEPAQGPTEPAQGPTESAAPVGVADPTGPAVVGPSTRPGRYTVRAQPPVPPPPSRPAAAPRAPASTTRQAAPRPPAPPARDPEPIHRRYERGGDTGTLCVAAGGDTAAPHEWCGSIEFDDKLSVLTVSACRDRGALTASALSFADGLEADFTVRDAGGSLVWQWSGGVAPPGPAHQLSYQAGDCYHWTVATDRFQRYDVTGWTVTGTVHGAELGDENSWSDTAPQD